MDKEQRLPLRLAKEFCQRFIERRVLSAAKLPEALKALGEAAMSLIAESQGSEALSLAGDLTARLIERGRLGTPAAAEKSLTELTRSLSEIYSALPPAKAGAALKCAVKLALKLLETNTTGSEPLPLTIRKLAEASAGLMPSPPATAAPAAPKDRSKR